MVILLKPGHVRADLRAQSRYRSCRSDAERRWKHAGEPNGFQFQPRNGGIAGSAGTGAWFCCWRGKRCSRPRALARDFTFACHVDTPKTVNGQSRTSPPGPVKALAVEFRGRPEAPGRVAVEVICKLGAAKDCAFSAKLKIIACEPIGLQAVGWLQSVAQPQAWPSCSRKRCASSAAMQPVPALVMAWR